MPLSSQRSLQLRIAGALALVVGVNAAVLGAVAWCGLQVWRASGRAAPTAVGLPLVLGAVLLGGIVTVLAQARYGARSAVAGLGLQPVEDGGPRNVEGRVTRLAKQAGVPAPSVAVADRSEPSCLTVDRDGSPTVVVTTGLLERLDDDELDAALAHEVAHVANRDLPVAAAVAAALSITDRLLEREERLWVILYNVGVIAAVTGVGILIFAIPIVALALVVLVLSVAARTLLALNAVALRLFSRTREYAADRAAASLTGDPASLAGALRTLEDGRPEQDLRLTAGATLGIVHLPISLDTDDEEDDEEGFVERFLMDPDEGPADSPKWKADPDDDHPEQSWIGERLVEPAVAAIGRVLRWVHERTLAKLIAAARRAVGWRPSTHPPTDERIERLRALETNRD